MSVSFVAQFSAAHKSLSFKKECHRTAQTKFGTIAAENRNLRTFRHFCANAQIGLEPEAEKSWKMTIERFPSQSDPNGAILRLRDVQRVE